VARDIPRDEELSDRAHIKKKIIELAKDVEQAFISQNDRSDDILDYWDVWNCKLGNRQFYNGNSQIFVPIVKAAIKARKTRFVNQLFPQSGRYVEVTTSELDTPQEAMSLCEHYIRRANLRTKVFPALCVNGDVEGQYNVYVSWSERKKNTASRVDKAVEMEGAEVPELGKTPDMEEEEIIDAGPEVEVIHDNDVMVLPVTCDTPEEALEAGGSVTICRRWTKAKIKQAAKDGEITEKSAEILKEMLSSKRPDPANRDTRKDMADAAGIKQSAGDKYALVYELWTNLKIGGKLRLCRAFYGGDQNVLGCKQNPYWCDEIPLISCPVEKQAGVFKGKAPIADVVDLQVAANDACNEGADAGHFAAMPIIMTDPEKNPKVGTMVLGMASIWEVDPNSTKFAQFPDMTEGTLARIASCKTEIFQILGVNPSMIPQSSGAKQQKRNQAEVANEQQVDILTTADAVTVMEEGVATPIIRRFMAYDHQFRDKAMTVMQYGEMGIKANMQEVPPLQADTKFEYRWFGVEQARTAQQIQQQIAGINVIKGIPPQMYPGYRLNLSPMLQRMTDNLFGHRLAPLIFEKVQGVTVDPHMENNLMDQGFDAPVHPEDDDMMHLQVHMQGMHSQMGDLHGKYRPHIMQHQQQMQAKAQAAQAQQNPQGLPGGPGGAGPGVAGAPRPGAQVAGPRLIKGPEGTIPQDQMPRAGSVGMPRKM
jgi:hypothetical protein